MRSKSLLISIILAQGTYFVFAFRNLVLPHRMFRFKVTRGMNASFRNDEFDPMQFGKFRIAPSQIFYHSPSKLSSAIVNLRPIVPGHVLVIPTRVVPLLKDLTDEEYNDMWKTVRLVQNMLTQKYGSDAFNVAVQDGKAAGQSVPHVHVHILPRKEGDFERNDDVYDELQDWAPTIDLSKEKKNHSVELDVPDDNDRKDRTMEQMEEEAFSYRSIINEF
jgi:bis(5'-adenosyl)-triphosphatase